MTDEYPIVCCKCKVVLCEDENGDLDQFHSDNYDGYLCNDCMDSLYYCEECKDYTNELVESRWGYMCEACHNSYSEAETNSEVKKFFEKY